MNSKNDSREHPSLDGEMLGRHLFCLDSAATTEDEEKDYDCMDYYWMCKNTSESQYWSIPCDIVLETHHGSTDVYRQRGTAFVKTCRPTSGFWQCEQVT